MGGASTDPDAVEADGDGLLQDRFIFPEQQARDHQP
jgi:hypothetical protein